MKKNTILLLIVTCGGAMLVYRAPAQTCQDGCFYSNTYQGSDAMLNFGSGGNNTAFGAYALTNMFGGENDTGVGAFALYLLTNGSDNTAVGVSALYSNTIRVGNTAVGVDALVSNVNVPTAALELNRRQPPQKGRALRNLLA